MTARSGGRGESGGRVRDGGAMVVCGDGRCGGRGRDGCGGGFKHSFTS